MLVELMGIQDCLLALPLLLGTVIKLAGFSGAFPGQIILKEAERTSTWELGLMASCPTNLPTTPVYDPQGCVRNEILQDTGFRVTVARLSGPCRNRAAPKTSWCAGSGSSRGRTCHVPSLCTDQAWAFQECQGKLGSLQVGNWGDLLPFVRV